MEYEKQLREEGKYSEVEMSEIDETTINQVLNKTKIKSR